MNESVFDYFKIEDNFKEIENVGSSLIFGSENKPVPKITFSIPTYKRARTLVGTIDSIRNQYHKFDFDIVIVDNNPERYDETESALEQYRNVENIRYYKNDENVGMAGNWNKCFLLPESEWVVLLHDDDLIRPDYLNNLIPCLKDNVDGIFPSLHSFNDGDEIPDYFPSQTLIIQKKNLDNLFLGNNPPSGIILRRKKVMELGGFTKRNFAPDIFLAKMLYYGNIYTALKPLVLYRKGINESTKIEAMEKMCVLNHDFRVQAWPKMGMPKFLIPYAIPYCDKNYEDLFRKSWNDSFRFHYLSQYTKNQISLAKFICRLFSCYLKGKRKLFLKTKTISALNA